MVDIAPRRDRGRAIAAVGLLPIVISLEAVSAGFFRFPPFFVGSVLSCCICELNLSYPWFLLAGGCVFELVISWFLIREPEKRAV